MMITNFSVTGTIGLILSLYAANYKQKDLEQTLEELDPDQGLPKIAVYDFIIVGAGTAGCLLASRLSERYSVLLLERGGPPPTPIDNPHYGYEISVHPDFNDEFTSVPQNFIKGNSSGINNVTCGRMLGGSGSHNGNIYVRGSPRDYNLWAKIVKDDSWNYTNILQHYKKIESFVGELFDNVSRTDYFGNTGPIYIETNTPPFLSTWFQVAKEMNYNIADPNALHRQAFTPMTKSTYNGHKYSTYNAYIKPIMKSRANLRVLTYSDVEEILIRNKTAYGVFYKRHGIAQIAHASKEVILSAGTFLSPIVLMKSGVGPGDLLREAKIPVQANRTGVGLNLRDHGGVFMKFTIQNSPDDIFPVTEDSEIENEIINYQSVVSSGVYTRQNLGHAQGFFVSKVAKERGDGDWPDIQIIFKQDQRFSHYTPQTLSMHVVATRLRSNGTVKLDTKKYRKGVTDPVELSVIDYRLFEVEEDRLILEEAMNITMQMMETPTLKKMNITLVRQNFPKCNGINDVKSYKYQRCIQQESSSSWYHSVGTCKMGVVEDPAAVVDSKFRVFGVKSLRVVDASIFPIAPGANPNAPVMMVAEKASQDIIKQYG